MDKKLSLAERVEIIEERLGIDYAAIAVDAAETQARGEEQNAEVEPDEELEPEHEPEQF